jgi:hypothetical protein
VTSELEVVRKALTAMLESGIDYMIVGSHAASVHGFTRATHDLDIVVSLRVEDIYNLAHSLGDDFFLDVESAAKAVSRKDLFNAIHMNSGVKVDFFILANDDFSHTQFSRRISTDLGAIRAWVATAEDTILSKLIWYRITPSDRQLTDVKGIIEAGVDRLDWDYISTWADKLGIANLLARVKEL